MNHNHTPKGHRRTVGARNDSGAWVYLTLWTDCPACKAMQKEQKLGKPAPARRLPNVPRPGNLGKVSDNWGLDEPCADPRD